MKHLRLQQQQLLKLVQTLLEVIIAVNVKQTDDMEVGTQEKAEHIEMTVIMAVQ
ncbi:hypothetical protein [Vibrio navarrensis]|uniref:Uncharacterized protein n=1 Tax=Vibrio navarrensis TaxID=29495 RepID=A0AAJ4IBB3_9VIBR|nr:hypothetical protein I3X05_00415 [Vibrio navarrensis]